MNKSSHAASGPCLRVAIFASVSSPQQATVDKDSLPSQLRDGRLWADSVAGDVVASFEVPGHSRKYIFFQDAEREIPAFPIALTEPEQLALTLAGGTMTVSVTVSTSRERRSTATRERYTWADPRLSYSHQF